MEQIVYMIFQQILANNSLILILTDINKSINIIMFKLEYILKMDHSLINAKQLLHHAIVLIQLRNNNLIA